MCLHPMFWWSTSNNEDGTFRCLQGVLFCTRHVTWWGNIALRKSLERHFSHFHSIFSRGCSPLERQSRQGLREESRCSSQKVKWRRLSKGPIQEEVGGSSQLLQEERKRGFLPFPGDVRADTLLAGGLVSEPMVIAGCRLARPPQLEGWRRASGGAAPENMNKPWPQSWILELSAWQS